MADFRLISEAWERELVAARRAHPSGLRIVCPFVKATALQRIVREGTAKNIELITRFDLNCFDQGVSDIAALRAVLAAGGKVRGVRGLHALARVLAATRGADEVMVIGGAQIYQNALPLADRVYFTEVHAKPGGDRHFPKLDARAWRETSREPLPKGPNDDYAATLIIFQRIAD